MKPRTHMLLIAALWFLIGVLWMLIIADKRTPKPEQVLPAPGETSVLR